MDSGIRQNFNVIVVAIKRKGDEMVFNPGPQTEIMLGDTLIVLGKNDQIVALKALV